MTGEEEREATGVLCNVICVVDAARVPYPWVHTTRRVDPNIGVKLEHLDLWKRFAKLDLEMIITKTGR